MPRSEVSKDDDGTGTEEEGSTKRLGLAPSCLYDTAAGSLGAFSEARQGEVKASGNENTLNHLCTKQFAKCKADTELETARETTSALRHLPGD